MRKATGTTSRYIMLRMLWVVVTLVISLSSKAQCNVNLSVTQVDPYGPLCSSQYATLQATLSGNTNIYGEFRWYNSPSGSPVFTQGAQQPYGDAYSIYTLYASPGQTVWVSYFNYNTG